MRADQVGEWSAQTGAAELAQAVVSEHWGVGKGPAPWALQLVREVVALEQVRNGPTGSRRGTWLS